VFTGLVEEVGTVRTLRREGDSVLLSIGAELVRGDLALGESVSVDGACLTVTALDGGGFQVGLAPETLRRTALEDAREGSSINLERAVRVGDRMGGHYVQGHIDATARILDFRPEGDSLVTTFEVPDLIGPYIVEKGFVAVDGISLTVTERAGSRFSVALVAFTRDHVALVDKKPGQRVNIEVDILAKYVESLLAARTQPQAVH
jgi:riboflavin synthase